jgi:membrane protease YdiL (CAAX protease family)
VASFILWLVPNCKPLRKFVCWVILPVALVVVPGILTLAFMYAPRHLFVAPPSHVLLDEALQLLPPIEFLGWSLYGTLLGLVVFVGLLWVMSQGRVKLPLRFTKTDSGASTEDVPAGFSRRVCKFIVVSLVLVLVFEIVIGSFVTAAFRHGELPLENWPKRYPLWMWIQATYGPAVVGLCALQILGTGDSQSVPVRQKSELLNFKVALVVPLAIVVGPRVTYELVLQFLFGANGRGTMIPPPSWRDMLDPNHTFPWVLTIFLTAWLIEFILRRCVQDQMAPRFGLKRTIVLSGLLWWVLPITKGTGLVPLQTAGVYELSELLAAILYNIPLAWLYARTRSLWLVTLMHGTMLVFHTGFSYYTFYANHPNFYWIETAGWIAASWYLFRKYPVDSPAQSPLQVALDAGATPTPA